MNPTELLCQIDAVGGVLTATPDGQLKFCSVPTEFYELLKEHKPALIALLIERAKPRPSNLLISSERLKAANERYLQEQAAKAAPAPSAPGVIYQPRTPEQWEKRANQSWQSNRTFRPPKPVTPRVEPDPEIGDAEPEDGDDFETPKSKVSSTTPCVCGHPRKDHHTTPEPHVADGDCAYYCVTSHCDVFSYRNGVSAPCDCQYFRVSETDALKFTKPRVGPHDLCAACGHFKISHCIKAKPGKVHRLKPGEMAFRIMTAPSGMAYGCRHFDPANPNCQCDSTGCSATPDDKNLCECLAFQNPWSVRKTKATVRKRAPRKPVAGSLTVAATGSTSESVPAKPRQSRKKKSTVFTTGETLFPPETTIASQPTGEKSCS